MKKNKMWIWRRAGKGKWENLEAEKQRDKCDYIIVSKGKEISIRNQWAIFTKINKEQKATILLHLINMKLHIREKNPKVKIKGKNNIIQRKHHSEIKRRNYSFKKKKEVILFWKLKERQVIAVASTTWDSTVTCVL